MSTENPPKEKPGKPPETGLNLDEAGFRKLLYDAYVEHVASSRGAFDDAFRFTVENTVGALEVGRANWWRYLPGFGWPNEVQHRIANTVTVVADTWFELIARLGFVAPIFSVAHAVLDNWKFPPFMRTKVMTLEAATKLIAHDLLTRMQKFLTSPGEIYVTLFQKAMSIGGVGGKISAILERNFDKLSKKIVTGIKFGFLGRCIQAVFIGAKIGMATCLAVVMFEWLKFITENPHHYERKALPQTKPRRTIVEKHRERFRSDEEKPDL